MGPFKLMDLIGVDTNFSVTSSMYQQFHQDPKFRPNRIQQQKVDAGHHGRKRNKDFTNTTNDLSSETMAVTIAHRSCLERSFDFRRL